LISTSKTTTSAQPAETHFIFNTLNVREKHSVQGKLDRKHAADLDSEHLNPLPIMQWDQAAEDGEHVNYPRILLE
jgi:hypothetical protein